MFLNGQACLLDRVPAGENSTRLSFFFRDQGLQQALLRERRKPGPCGPDLFQIGDVTLRKKSPEAIGFVVEFSLSEDFSGIARSYQQLTAASVTTRFFQRNLLHLESYETAWELLVHALRAYAARPLPSATLFKLVYRFARDEGYPVTRGWLHALSTASRVEIETLLRAPLDELVLPEARVLHWLERLSHYLERETAIYPPDWSLLSGGMGPRSGPCRAE